MKVNVNKNGTGNKVKPTPTAAPEVPQEVNENVAANPVDELIQDALQQEAEQELANIEPDTDPTAIPEHTKPFNVSVSLEDTMFRVEVLTDLIEKREKLVSSLKKLNSFDTSRDNRGLGLQLRDGNASWETNNTGVIATLVIGLKAEISKKIIEVNSQIKF